MSWLSPKRRKTTGNLKSIPNAHVNNNSDNVPPLPPPTPETPTRPETSKSERPSSTPRKLSQQPLANSALPDLGGNLFYAYARRGDELKSRYLLTFASAGIANDWWQLLQIHFPDTSRPGPQLFSFKDADLLSKAWKHPSFAHLKSKWMYISFGDTTENGIGGATQGIIPVQDVQGNMLGGSAPASPEIIGQFGQVKREAKGVRNELTKLEEYFEKMMTAVQMNTEQVAALANKQQAAIDEGVQKQEDTGYVDKEELSGYLSQINELLSRNSEHVEGLAKRQSVNDQKLQIALQDLSERQKNDRSDLSQLSAHLDRIQSLMEQSVIERKDSAKELAEQQPRGAMQIDWSPLTNRLEKVQEAVEQNSALIKALLDEGAAGESKPGTPFWAGNTAAPSQPPSADLSPLSEHLEKIHSAIEQQSQHVQALVGFASGDDNNTTASGSRPGDTAEKSLAPLGEHLEQIFNAIEEGNKHARDVAGKAELKQLDLSPLSGHLEALRRSAADNNRNTKALLESQEGIRVATESASRFDMTPLTSKLDEVTDQMRKQLESQDVARQAIEAKSKSDLDPLLGKLDVLTEHARQLLESQNALRATAKASKTLDLAPLNDRFDTLSEHLEALRTSSDKSATNMKQMVEAQESLRTAITDGSKTDFALLGEKLDGLSEHLESLREWTEFNAEQFKDFVESTKAEQENAQSARTIDFSPLTDHLGAVRSATESNSAHVKALLDAHKETLHTSNNEIDFTPLTERLNRIHAALEKQADRRNLSPGTGDSKFIMSALTSHLSKIQAVTDANAQHTKILRESHSASQDKMHIAVAQTAEQVSALTEYQTHNDEKMQAAIERNAQQVQALREKQSAGQDKMQSAVSQTAAQVNALAAAQARSDDKANASNNQVRELMAGQREMVGVMRDLATSITAQNKGACDHVVIPPPRKMGRKIVGFVYDAKDGPA